MKKDSKFIMLSAYVNMHGHMTIFIAKFLLIFQERALEVIQFIHVILWKLGHLPRVTNIYLSEWCAKHRLWISKLPHYVMGLYICFACLFSPTYLKKNSVEKLKEKLW